MGDRGNIIVKDANSEVYLYTHWTGSDLPDVLRAALKRGKSRWNDGPYLARIIFCEMVKGEEMDETGFGISSTLGDGGTNITVNVDGQKITDHRGREKTFTEYVS